MRNLRRREIEGQNQSGARSVAAPRDRSQAHSSGMLPPHLEVGAERTSDDVLNGPRPGPADAPASPKTPGVLLEQLERLLRKHPQVAERLHAATAFAAPASLSAKAYRRKVARRSFYVVLTIVVAVLASTVAALHRVEQERVGQERAEQERAERAAARHRWNPVGRAVHSLSPKQKQVLALQAVAIAANLVLAVRGIQIWRQFRRLQIERWIHNIHDNLPWTRRVVRVLDVVSLPVRRATKPFAPLARAGRPRPAPGGLGGAATRAAAAA